MCYVAMEFAFPIARFQCSIYIFSAYDSCLDYISTWMFIFSAFRCAVELIAKWLLIVCGARRLTSHLILLIVELRFSYFMRGDEHEHNIGYEVSFLRRRRHLKESLQTPEDKTVTDLPLLKGRIMSLFYFFCICRTFNSLPATANSSAFIFFPATHTLHAVDINEIRHSFWLLCGVLTLPFYHHSRHGKVTLN